MMGMMYVVYVCMYVFLCLSGQRLCDGMVWNGMV
jgi:hypothetical protein